MEEAEQRHCYRLGRPRSEAARQAILRAANDLLARDGFAAVTMEAIAAEAGVSKATLYRWWPCKAAVVMDAFLAATGPCPPFPDTGCVREDLRGQMRRAGAAFGGTMGTVLPGCWPKPRPTPRPPRPSARATSPRAGRRRAEVLGVRASTRGRSAPMPTWTQLTDALYGPLYYRLLAGHAPLDAVLY